MTGVRLAIHRTFHSLRVRNFRLYFFGQFVSVTGTWIQSVASAWLVLSLTGSGVALGIVTALNFAPLLLLGPWGGVIADRVDKRRTLIATQSAFAVLALALGILTVTGLVRVWEVYLLSLAQGIVTAIDNPTRQSFYAEMVGEKDLTNAVSLNSAVMTGTRVIGPGIAAGLIAAFGTGQCFLVNAASYVAVIAGLLLMRPQELHTLPEREPGRGGVREGLRYVWERPALRGPLMLMAVVFTLSFNFTVLFPLLATRALHGSVGTFGSMAAVMGVGSVIGALALAHRSKPSPKLLPLGALGFGVISVAVAWAPSIGVELPLLVALGFTSIVFMVTGNSTMQLTSSDEMRGRVMALYSMAFLGTTPFGAMLAGWGAEHFGSRMALGAGGMVAVASGLIGMLILRRQEAEQPKVERSMGERPILATAVPQPSMRQSPPVSGLDMSRTSPSRVRTLKRRNMTPSRSSIQERSTSTGSSSPPRTMARGLSSARPPE